MKSVGIDIGSASIKMAEVVETNKGLLLTSFQEHLLGQNPAFDPAIEILEFLRTLANKYDPDQVRLVVGLRQDHVSVRNKTFPFSDRNKILKSLPFELEEDLPLAPESTIYDAKLVKTFGPSAEVLACATPGQRVRETLQQINDTGLDISILSTEGAGLANCWENWKVPPPALPPLAPQLDENQKTLRPIHVVLHLGHTRTLVLAFEGASLIGIRSLLWGGKNIAEAIMKRYEIPFVEAMKELQTKAFILPNKEGASYDQIVFSDTISAAARNLAQEVRISLLEFQSELNGNVTSVGLTGGLSQILNLNLFLTQMLEVPVNKLPVLNSFPQVYFERTPHAEAVCGVAVGLAIEALKKPRNPPLNFLKGEFAKQNRKLQNFWQNWGPLLQVGAAMFVAFVIFSMIREQVSLSLSEKAAETLKDQAKKVAQLPAKQASESGIKKFIREQKRKADDIKAVVGLTKMNSAMDVLKKLTEALPARNAITLNVSHIAILTGKVEIEGSVAHNQELVPLQNALRQIASNGKVQTLQPKLKAKAGATPFAYSLMMDRNLSMTK